MTEQELVRLLELHITEDIESILQLIKSMKSFNDLEEVRKRLKFEVKEIKKAIRMGNDYIDICNVINKQHKE